MPDISVNQGRSLKRSKGDGKGGRNIKHLTFCKHGTHKLYIHFIVSVKSIYVARLHLYFLLIRISIIGTTELTSCVFILSFLLKAFYVARLHLYFFKSVLL